jgi:hypothetical protein
MVETENAVDSAKRLRYSGSTIEPVPQILSKHHW